MCVGIPHQVVEVMSGAPWALVEASGIRQQVGTDLVGSVKVGDWLLIHAGYAISRLDFAAAAEVLDLLNKWELSDV